MATYTKSSVLSAIKKLNSATATAVAKEVGLAKANEGFKKILDELLSDGSVKVENNGRYDMYSVVTKKDSEVSAKKAPAESSVRKVGDDNSGLKEITLSGYTFKQNQKGYAVTPPDGKTVQIKTDEYLLIINNKPYAAITSAKDVFVAIHEYSAAAGFTTFVVKNVATGKIIGTKDDIELNDKLLVLSIDRHNKAA